MKILMLTETLSAGGAEIFTVRLCNALCREHEVILFNIHPELSKPELIESLDKRVRLINFRQVFRKVLRKTDTAIYRSGIDGSLSGKLLVRRLADLIRKLQPDVVHSHLFKTDYYANRALIKLRYPGRHVITIHGDYSAYHYHDSASRWLNIHLKMKQILDRVDAVVCLSEEQMQFFSKHYPALTHKKYLVYNGYEPLSISRSLQETPIPEGFVIGMVARGVEKKGWLKAIRAFISADIPGSCLVLVGSGEYLDMLAKEYSSPNIIFTGFLADTLPLIRRFDLCVLPSLFVYESLPTVIMEYLYCGKPVIATNVGEISKMLEDPETGSLAGDLLSFDGHDIKEEELTKLLLRYSSDPVYLQEKQELSGPAFRKFDMSNCVRNYEKIYRGES